MAPRTHGSVRYDPYYKVQWWEERSLAWRDVQRAYTTEEEARATIPAVMAAEGSPRCRLMLITPAGRRPVPEPTAQH